MSWARCRSSFRGEAAGVTEPNILITCESFAAELRSRLEGRARIAGRGVSVGERARQKPRTLVLSHPKRFRSRAVEVVADSLANTVMYDWEPRLVGAILQERFPALLEEDGEYLSEALRELLQPISRPDEEWVRRRNCVFGEIEDFLREEDHLILEGFLSFRAVRYRRALEKRVDRAVAEWITGGPGRGPGIDDAEMDLVLTPEGAIFLSDVEGTVLMRGWIEDIDLAEFVLRYLVSHRVPVLTVHDPANWWEAWSGASRLPSLIDDLDACFGCTLCLGVRSSR